MIAFVVPGRLNQLTGGYIYDRRIVQGLRQLGHRVIVKETSARRAARALAAIPDGAVVILDGLLGGVIPREVEREAARLRFVALVHHPLAHETGVSKRDAVTLRANETRTLACAASVVVTSPATARLLADRYHVAPRRIVCIEPGTDRMRLASGFHRNALLCVATLTPRKGHVTLVRALARIAHLEWHLTCVGSLRRDRGTVRRVRAAILAHGLRSRITLLNETSSRARLMRHYEQADVFVLATEYEGYGMAVAEAVASGLPVVSTPTGAIPRLVGRGDGGILVPPRDDIALARALSRILADRRTLGRFTAGARRRRRRLPTWTAAVRRFAAVVRQVSAT